MGAFAAIDRDLRCQPSYTAKTTQSLRMAEEAYERDKRSFMNDLMGKHMRELSRIAARAHGDWNNLKGKRIYLRNKGDIAGAMALAHVIEHTYQEYAAAQKEYDSWAALYPEAR